MKLHPDIVPFVNEVATAQQRLREAVQQHYPTGTDCMYRRSPRVQAARVVILSHGKDTRLFVVNGETGSRYWVEGTNPRLQKLFS